jgi:hypothetical protein
MINISTNPNIGLRFTIHILIYESTSMDIRDYVWNNLSNNVHRSINDNLHRQFLYKKIYDIL